MEKLLENLSAANSFAGVTSGLLAAQTLCRRRIIEATTDEERVMVCNIMGDIVAMMEKYEAEYFASK
jgi:hypothetical protein